MKAVPPIPQEGSPASRWGSRLGTLAAFGMLCVLVSRVFLGEMPFRPSLFDFASSWSSFETTGYVPVADRGELARLTFATILAGLSGLTVLAESLQRRRLRAAWLLPAIGVLAGLSLVGSLVKAGDVRGSLCMWYEQMSLVTAGWACAQLFGRHDRLRLLLAVLAGLAASLAAKGIWQLAVDIPERIAFFESMGPKDPSPETRLLEMRVRDLTPSGFFSLANVFACGLIGLAAAAWAVFLSSLIGAMQRRETDHKNMAAGELHLPTFISCALAIFPLAASVVLVLTRSLGGVVAAVVAAGLGLAVATLGPRLGTYRRKVVVAAWIAVAAGIGVVIVAGIARDSLPGKTMTFRWFYWTGSVEIAAGNPLLGTGLGEFDKAYLAVRRPAAEEAIQLPHNFVLASIAQLGVIGGTLLAGLAVWPLLLAGFRGLGDLSVQRVRDWSAGLWCVVGLVFAATAILARAVFSDWGGMVAALLVESAIPAVILAVAVAGAGWAGRWSVSPRFGQIALAAGLAGMLLHCMVSIGFWIPATSTLIWMLAGALLAQIRSREGKPVDRPISTLGWLVHVGVMAVAIVAVTIGVLLLLPALRRADLADRLLAAQAAGDRGRSLDLATRYARADRLDALAAADASKAVLRVAADPQEAQIRAYLQKARELASLAVERDPGDFSHQRQLGLTDWFVRHPDVFLLTSRPVHGDPEVLEQDLRRQISSGSETALSVTRLADVLQARNRPEAATRWYERATTLAPGSVQAWLNYGDAAWRIGDESAAFEAWQQAALLQTRESKRRPVLPEGFEKALERNPNSIQLNLQLAEMYSILGRRRETISQLNWVRFLSDQLIKPSVFEISEDQALRMEMIRVRASVIGRAMEDQLVGESDQVGR